MRIYKVEVDGENIEYGANSLRSRFSEEAWLAICREMVRVNRPDLYEEYKNDKTVIKIIGHDIHLSERYELLLELLPQDSFSKAGTHPAWVVEAVNENTLNKGFVQDDIQDILNEENNIEQLKNEIRNYLKI